MFGMRPKVEERLAARALRVKGWPLRRIAEELGVSLGSVSLWTRDVNRLRPLRTIRLPVISGALRVCPRCERLQPIELFSRSNRDGRQHWCKDCFRDYFRARGDNHRAQVAAAKERRRGLARALVLEYLAERSCADCEEARVGVLEFDHVRPPKTANISDLVATGASAARVEAELEKCEVVCVNCHRRRTERRRASARGARAQPAASPARRPRDRNQAFVDSVLERSRCVDCGEEDSAVLEFDHVGSKRFAISDAVGGERALAELEAEIARCEIRCANCHRLRTAERGRHFRASSVMPP